MNLSYRAETKLLGVHFTETLKWKTHALSLANIVSTIFLMSKSLREIVSPFMVCNIYFSEFQSLLQFEIINFGRGGGRRPIPIKQYLEYKKGDKVYDWN
jgi:uncharacterized Fe-S cluster-containing radical SAM superfamily enzyme